MAYAHSVINQITLPNGTLLDVNDAKAYHFLGTTVTNVTAASGIIDTDTINVGTTESPVNVVVEIGDAAIYGSAKNMYYCTAVSHTENATSSTWINISPAAAEVGDGTITVSGTGVTTQTFTTNQSANGTITVDVPIKEIKVNDAALTPDASQSVNIEIPTDSMTFKGTVGDTQSPTSATRADVPVDGSAKVGDAYKVVTDGDYANDTITAKVGDLLVCLTKDTGVNTWVLIPSGDDIDVQSVAAGVGLATASGDPITTTGTIKAALNNETPLAAAATTGVASDRVFSVVLDTTTTGEVGEEVTTHNLAVAIPAGSLATTVSDATSGNTVVTGISTSAASETVPAGGVNPYSYSNGVLTLNYITNTTSSHAVFDTINP